MTAQTSLKFEETETEKKTRVLSYIEDNYKYFLVEVRKYARWFCYKNRGYPKYGIRNSVTANDIREYFEIEKQIDGSNNIMGQVFRVGWDRVGWYSSKQPGSHGTVIGIWTPVKKEAA